MLKLMLLSGLLLWTQGVRAGEESLYDFLWLDPDKSVYVLQNKIHKKEKSIYVDVGYLSNFTSTFQDTSGAAAKVGYYFHEEWAVEAMYLGYTNSNNDNYKNVELLNGGVPFIRRPLSTMGLGIVWSPFYGKINTFNSIVYFDWSFGLGYAKIQTESNLETARVSSAVNRYDRENYSGAYVKSAVKFHVNQNWHIGIEWVGTQYFAPGPRNPKNKLHRSNNDLILQLGWSY